MNYLDTTNEGGHPLYLEDLGFIQDAYKEAIAGITQGLGAESYILSGCKKTLQSPGIWHISEGFVVLDKEVFKVPSHTVTFLNENAPLYFKIKIDFPLPSPVFYKEKGAVEMNVHNRKTAIVTTEVTDYSYSLSDVLSLIDLRGRRETGSLTLLNGWTGRISYTIVHGRIQLHGYIRTTSNIVQSKDICKIPADLSPYAWRYEGYSGVDAPWIPVDLNDSTNFGLIKVLL